MATLPTTAPAHARIPRPALLQYMAGYAQSRLTGLPAVLPAAAPAHAHIPRPALLRYLAGYAQPAA